MKHVNYCSAGKASDEGMVMEGEGDGEGARCLVTQRHLSLDSTRDSGIGDGSNSSHSAERHMSVESDSTVSLAQRLPGEFNEHDLMFLLLIRLHIIQVKISFVYYYKLFYMGLCCVL